MLPKNKWVNEEIKKEIIENLEMNKIGSIALKSLWDAAKVVLKRKALRPSSRNKKNPNKQSDLPHVKELGKEQTMPKVSRRNDYNNDQRENKLNRGQRTVEKINEKKNYFFEKINKINKPLYLPRRKERNQIK